MSNILGLDIGDKRIGVARANLIAKIPEPIGIIKNDDTFEDSLRNIINKYDIGLIIVGLPRNMSGEETAQSQKIKHFVNEKLNNYQVKFQDETLTSVEATSRLGYMVNPKQLVDDKAACVILEDYLNEI